MTRLYEEVQTRLEEMAMIISRTLKIQADRNAQVMFSPRALAAGAESTPVEIIRTPCGGGCYDYDQGACIQCE